MANKAETNNKPWEVDPFKEEQILQSAPDLQEKTIELAQFLKGAPLDMIQINSVIPSTNFGLLLNLTLGKVISHESGANVMLIYNTEGTALSNLENNLNFMKKKKRKEHKDVINNINSIKDFVTNPLNWGPQYNTGRES
jgi:hypothetical protein